MKFMVLIILKVISVAAEILLPTLCHILWDNNKCQHCIQVIDSCMELLF